MRDRRIRHRGFFSIIALLSFDPEAVADVEGKVKSKGAKLPVEHARVVCGDEATLTDAAGGFRLDGDAPCELVVSHARYEEARQQVAPGADVEIELVALQGAYEQVVVTADREGRTLAPVAAATSERSPDEAVGPPMNVTDLVVALPGVAETGQGGLFQTYAVRGISGPRLTALYCGVPIVTERRAGVSLSFVDPTLLEAVEVVRGPASTLYVGALGGVVQAIPLHVDGAFAELGYDSQGAERWASGGAGDEDWSVGLSARHQDDAETPEDAELYDGFTQFSGVLWKRWDLDDKTLEVSLLPSLADDIHKDNTDTPSRFTTYPRETHTIARVALSGDHWRADVYAHPSSLETEVVRANGDFNNVQNDAVDAGGSASYSWDLGRATHVTVGTEIFARTNVNADEEGVSGGEPVELHTLDDAWQQEAALFATLRAPAGRASIQAGARIAGIQQANEGYASESAFAPSAFVGASIPFGTGLEAVASVGTGFRFPSLSERFFSGTTGRGGVLGNPDLDEERSLSAEVGLRYFGSRLFVETRLFQNHIDDYIEQVDVSDDITTFVNLTAGDIRGAELDGFVAPAEGWQITFGATVLDGESDQDVPLLDIPANRARLGLRYFTERWHVGLEVEQRSKKDEDDIGDGEKAIPGATLVALRGGVELPAGFAILATGSNLLDETYFRSADGKEPVAQGASYGLTLRFRR